MLTLLTLLSCVPDIGETIGCDFRNQASSPEDRCQERSGLQSNGFDAMCEGLGGKVVDGGCSRKDSVGECATAEDVVDVYYSPTTAADAEADCADDDGDFTGA